MNGSPPWEKNITDTRKYHRSTHDSSSGGLQSRPNLLHSLVLGKFQVLGEIANVLVVRNGLEGFQTEMNARLATWHSLRVSTALFPSPRKKKRNKQETTRSKQKTCVRCQTNVSTNYKSIIHSGARAANSSCIDRDQHTKFHQTQS